MNWLSRIATDKNMLRFVLAVLWTVFACTYIMGITFWEIPENNLRIVDTIVGFLLGTICATIIGFYFGSSHGSSEKTDLLKTNDVQEHGTD